MSRYNRGGKSAFGSSFLATLLGGLMLVALGIGAVAVHNHFNNETPTEEVEQEEVKDEVETEEEVEVEEEVVEDENV